MPVIECDTDLIDAADVLEIDLSEGTVKNITKNTTIKTKPLPGVMLTILQEGGLAEHFKKHGGFNI